MHQILRCCKIKLSILTRFYGTQSTPSTYYETLRIPRTSTQKEIREAFIKLTKENHPDIKGKGNHAEFVKINEAYNVLSKEHLKNVYDSDLKYQDRSKSVSYTPYSSYPSHPHSRGSDNRYQYYYRTPNSFRENWSESQNNENYYWIKGLKWLTPTWIVVICVFCSSFILTMEMVSMRKRVADYNEKVRLRNSQYLREFRESQREAEGKTKEEQLQALKNKLEQHSSQN